MAPALLRRGWSSVQWFGWRVLCETRRRYGFVPGPAPHGPRCVVPEVDPADDSRAWQRCWHGLSDAERGALAAVPAGMALHRAVRDADPGAVLACLDGPGVAAMPEPLVTQAAELVGRLALLAGGRG